MPRLPILLADGIGIIFVAFWLAKIAPLIMAMTLTAMLLIYGSIKYRPLAKIKNLPLVEE